MSEAVDKQALALSKAFAKARESGKVNMRFLNLKAAPEALFADDLRQKVDEIHLDDNALAVIPADIGVFVNLTVLSLDNNQLTQVPAEIGVLLKLRSLRLCYNQLTSLPPMLGQLLELEELYVNNNKLSSLPPLLGMLTKLKTLSAANNSLISPPKATVEKGTKAMLEYLKGQMKSAKSSMNQHIKVCVVGEENVGKTSLARALARDKWSSKEAHIDQWQLSTDGVETEMYSLRLPCTIGGMSDFELSFSVWDFGGHDVYYDSHQYFISENCIFLCAWDLRSVPEEACVEYWIRTMRARAPSSKIVVVGTHADDSTLVDQPTLITEKIARLKSHLEAQECGSGLIEFVAVSNTHADELFNAKKLIRRDSIRAGDVASLMGSGKIDGYTGIRGLKNLIVNKALTLDTVGALVPSHYHNIDRELVRLASESPTWPVMSRVDLVTHIEKFTKEVVQDKDGSFDLMAKYFHEQGRILYFGDDQKLRETIILRPQFLADLLRTMISTKQVFSERGMLMHKDLFVLGGAWMDTDDAKAAIMLDLLHRYFVTTTVGQGATAAELVYSMSPLMVPSIDEWPEQPDDGERQLTKRLVMPFVPRGLFVRLVAEMRTNEEVRSAFIYQGDAVMFFVSGDERHRVRLQECSADSATTAQLANGDETGPSVSGGLLFTVRGKRPIRVMTSLTGKVAVLVKSIFNGLKYTVDSLDTKSVLLGDPTPKLMEKTGGFGGGGTAAGQGVVPPDVIVFMPLAKEETLVPRHPAPHVVVVVPGEQYDQWDDPATWANHKPWRMFTLCAREGLWHVVMNDEGYEITLLHELLRDCGLHLTETLLLLRKNVQENLKRVGNGRGSNGAGPLVEMTQERVLSFYNSDASIGRLRALVRRLKTPGHGLGGEVVPEFGGVKQRRLHNYLKDNGDGGEWHGLKTSDMPDRSVAWLCTQHTYQQNVGHRKRSVEPTQLVVSPKPDRKVPTVEVTEHGGDESSGSIPVMTRRSASRMSQRSADEYWRPGDA